MKKAKLILAAVAVLAIAGGTVAFKAGSTYSNVTYYYTLEQGEAPANTLPSAITVAAGGVQAYWTTSPTGTASNFNRISTGL